ncbi:MAG TPA: hypothetical protein VEX37_03060 [Thermomicrobiales bacterium]|nr:hypothetical protein [Thermomicrobiales bacterium]
MSIKDDLHTLVDQLDDDEAVVAISYLREILDAESTASKPRRKSLDERMGPLVVSYREFASTTDSRSLSEIAREQGVEPISDLSSLRADFWPEDESVDEMVETIRKWRREGG